MKPQAVCITTRRPRDANDPGEAETIYYVVADNVVKITDAEGHVVRFADGEPVRRALGPGEEPRMVASGLGRRYLNQAYGDRERGFNRDISGINGRRVPT